MDSVSTPIVSTTAFSLALHAALLAVALPATEFVQATGQGIAIELVSSTYVSNQRETEQAASKQAASSQQPQRDEKSKSDNVVVTKKQQQMRKPLETLAHAAEPAPVVSDDEGSRNNIITRSTNASNQQLSIIELLHTQISAHKQYPYMAKRQRREGIARVEFVLSPDGSIDDTRLVRSSRVGMLDKAALEAVRGIEPFEPARDYLHQPEAFQVDVVFNIL